MNVPFPIEKHLEVQVVLRLLSRLGWRCKDTNGQPLLKEYTFSRLCAAPIEPAPSDPTGMTAAAKMVA
jgi:hypothetical protein